MLGGQVLIYLLFVCFPDCFLARVLLNSVCIYVIDPRDPL